MSDLEELTRRYREFSRERDWEKFHDPRSLVLALVGEVGELCELFQWRDSNEDDLPGDKERLQRRAAEEIADVLLYLVRLSDVLDIDPLEAAAAKLSCAERRFPVEEVLGSAPDKLA
jgi:dCTP diphosphatase